MSHRPESAPNIQPDASARSAHEARGFRWLLAAGAIGAVGAASVIAGVEASGANATVGGPEGQLGPATVTHEGPFLPGGATPLQRRAEVEGVEADVKKIIRSYDIRVNDAGNPTGHVDIDVLPKAYFLQQIPRDDEGKKITPRAPLKPAKILAENLQTMVTKNQNNGVVSVHVKKPVALSAIHNPELRTHLEIIGEDYGVGLKELYGLFRAGKLDTVAVGLQKDAALVFRQNKVGTTTRITAEAI